MKNDMENWLNVKGLLFLEGIGIKRGQKMLDFGCGTGHYSIPAAKAVGESGRVYALDKDSKSLEQLKQVAQSEGLVNVVPVLAQSDGLETDLESGSIDAMLLYDVLHYMERDQRKTVYKRARALLKNGGILSVYPKHCKSDEPLMNFADSTLDDINEEIENAGFVLERTLYEELMHDESLNKGQILNYRKPATPEGAR